MRPNRTVSVSAAGLALLALVAFGTPATQAAPPTEATVLFGNERTGSEAYCGPDRNPSTPALDCPPTRFVGESAEAVDLLIPGTVAIAQGGSVTFDVTVAPHRVGICAPRPDGSTVLPDQVSLTNLVDANPAGGISNHLADCPSPLPLTGPSIGVDVTYTFADAGKYLVICTFPPHFVDREMYGWVIVH